MTDHPSHWYALYTRSRHEKQVARYLERLKIPVFLPLKREWSTRTDRKVTLEVPALPGYLFFRCPLYAETQSNIKRAPGVVHIVESGSRPAEIPETQIDALRVVLANAFNPEGHPYLKCGDRVRVIRGPLLGIEGYLVRAHASQHRLVIAVDHVNQALSVEVDAQCVEQAD